MRFVALMVVSALCVGSAAAQNAKDVVQNALKTMGDVKSIQFSGGGHTAPFGQALNPAAPWPLLNMPSYSRLTDYMAHASREEMTRAEPPNFRGGGGPFDGEQKQISLVKGEYAWNLAGNNAQPAVAAASERQLQIWLTPHGFLKAAAESTSTAKKVKGGTEVSFTALGMYKIVGIIDRQNLVTRTETWIPNPVLGDMAIETSYSDYKDFSGVKFPTTIVQKHGGYPLFDVAVTDVKADLAMDSTVPESVRSAKVPPVQVQAQKLGEGLWWIGGGTHHSVVVEYPTHIAVIEAPLNEERSLAVISEAKKLVPGKPIKYLVNTHHHFDHSGGLRTYVAEGAEIITHPVNKPYYEAAFKAPRTLAPDKLSQSPKKAKFTTVRDKYTLAEGDRKMELYHIEGDTHNEGFLMIYFPKERVLVEADDFTPRPPNSPAPPSRAMRLIRDLNANIQRLNLEIDTIAPLHGFVVPYSEFKKAVGNT